jgi:hypothetical protein
LFLRTNGGTGTTLYIKESGTGNTGWVAVSSGGSGVGAEAVGCVDATGTLAAGAVGIDSAAHTGTGVFTVTLSVGRTVDEAAILVTPVWAVDVDFPTGWWVEHTSDAVKTIYFYDLSDANEDYAFSVAVIPAP